MIYTICHSVYRLNTLLYAKVASDLTTIYDFGKLNFSQKKGTEKIGKIWTPGKIAVIILKFEQYCFSINRGPAAGSHRKETPIPARFCDVEQLPLSQNFQSAPHNH